MSVGPDFISCNDDGDDDGGDGSIGVDGLGRRDAAVVVVVGVVVVVAGLVVVLVEDGVDVIVVRRVLEGVLVLVLVLVLVVESLLVPVLVVVLVVRAGEVAAAVLVTRLDKIVVDLLTPETTHTNIHAGYTAVLPGEPPLPGSHLILPLRTSPLIPCTIFFSDRRRNGGKIGVEKVCNSMRGKLVQRFCGRMPFLSTTSGKENS